MPLAVTVVFHILLSRGRAANGIADIVVDDVCTGSLDVLLECEMDSYSQNFCCCDDNGGDDGDEDIESAGFDLLLERFRETEE